MKLSLRIWILIIVLALSLISIFVTPNFLESGVIITSVETNSSAFEQGLKQGQVITRIDENEIKSVEDFSSALQEKFDANTSVKTIFETKDATTILFSSEIPQITVSEISLTNIKTGLDLAGGSRALIQAEGKQLSSSEVQDLVDITSNRLNEFGLTDLRVVPVSDLSGNSFMLIEIAGATPRDLEDLISKQGKFEAKIGNDTIFFGGEGQGIASVSRSGQDSGVFSCDQSSSGQYFCNFRFTVFLTEVAAKRQAEITAQLGTNISNPGYLDKPLDLYLDDKLVDSLQISEGLKGSVTTQISISGSGTGETRDDAVRTAEREMKQLQTVLITGSLPFKLEIVKLDTISPVLGKQFINTIFLAGLAAILAVSIIVFFRYRNVRSSLALIITSVSEVIIILGIASFIEWNLDLPSIAGILATIGTGIDSQIIVLDEARQKTELNIRQRLKRAFAIIMGAYFTALVALLPLMWAGAGLLKGFAITTIIGITTGVLITRPAFTDMIRRIEE